MKFLLPLLVVITCIECVSWDRFTERRYVLPDCQTGRCRTRKDCKILLDRYLLHRTSNRRHTTQDIIKAQESSSYNEKRKIYYSKRRSQTKLECLTRDRQRGRCVEWENCPHLINSMKNLKYSDICAAFYKYLRQNKCGSSRKNDVCCPFSTTPTFVPPTTVSATAHPLPFISSTPTTTTVQAISSSGVCLSSAHPPDRSTSCCGIGEKDTNRIKGGQEAGIFEYPWMALIEYRGIQPNDNFIHFLCAGSLISGKYVLTAAHCVEGKILKVGKPTSVRLGEYDTSSEKVDCVAVDGDGTICTSGEISVPIDKIISHPAFTEYSKIIFNDIALIMLSRMINYTDSIRPICLPPKDVSRSFNAYTMFHTAGWGATALKDQSDILLHVEVPYVPRNKCKSLFVFWVTGYICAGGQEERDSGVGDSGGPLMYENGNVYDLVGITSFGPKYSSRNVPAIYTNVSNYLPWIWSHIED